MMRQSCGASRHTDLSTFTGNSLNRLCKTVRMARDHKSHALKCAKLTAGVAEARQHLGETSTRSAGAGASPPPPVNEAGDNIAVQNEWSWLTPLLWLGAEGDGVMPLNLLWKFV